MAEFTRAMRNAYVAGIVITVVAALGAAAAGAKDTTVITLGLAALVAIIAVLWLVARNNERTLELTVDQAKEIRLRQLFELEAQRVEADRLRLAAPMASDGDAGS
jgi:hypothetical protein